MIQDLEVDPQVFVQIKLASAADQNCSQVGLVSPVARLVGIGQGEAVNAVAKSHGVQLARAGSKRHFDVVKALAPSQLGKAMTRNCSEQLKRRTPESPP
jgi:hypothetical protein